MVSVPTASDGREAGGPALPLRGLRVLELGVLPAASYCARMFADFGADVLKVEPAGGDPGRRLAPLVGGEAAEGAYFGYLSYNKRSAVADPAKRSDCEALRVLIGTCDVLVDSRAAIEREAF